MDLTQPTTKQECNEKWPASTPWHLLNKTACYNNLPKGGKRRRGLNLDLLEGQGKLGARRTRKSTKKYKKRGGKKSRKSKKSSKRRSRKH
jgi:hypothetical protein